ncbi:MAG: hypothetical protein AAFR83_25470 [Cyanobacteria bacterium J06629_18]
MKKEKADGVNKGPIWKGLKVWVMGFEKSKRVKGLAVIPEEHRDFLFPALSPIPEDEILVSNPQDRMLNFIFKEFPSGQELTKRQEEELLAGVAPVDGVLGGESGFTPTTAGPTLAWKLTLIIT